MRLALMIEGQEGVTWEDWQALARAAEEGGFDALFRSDHYVGLMGEETRGSLDAWGTVCALAASTSTLRLGTLVSPATFRHPSALAKLAVTADHVSGGRVELGMGAGWNEREHAAYGFPFPELGDRYDLFEEQVEVVRRQLTEELVDHDGSHYRLDALEARPRPLQDPLPLLIGGEAGTRSARIAARFADEYNIVGADPDGVREKRQGLAAACEEVGRDAADLRVSVMSAVIVGEDDAAVRDRGAQLLQWLGRDAEVDEFLGERRGRWIVGTPDEAVEQLRSYADAGADRVMLQHLLHRDLDAVELLAREVLPAFHS